MQDVPLTESDAGVDAQPADYPPGRTDADQASTPASAQLADRDVYALAYAAGWRLAGLDDEGLRSLIELRRPLGSYLNGPEATAYEQLDPHLGSWWAAFDRGWEDRLTGRDPEVDWVRRRDDGE